MEIANTTTVRLHNVVIATDFSECSERALRHGLATARHFGATVHLLNLIRPSTYAIVGRGVLPEVSELAHRDGSKLIAKLKAEGRLGDLGHKMWVLEGEIPDVLPDFVRRNGIDLIVIGTHGRTGVPKFIFGSVAQQVFEHSSCPVLTVGPYSAGSGPELRLKQVLFPTDLSEESTVAIPYVRTAIQQTKAELTVLHVQLKPTSLAGELEIAEPGSELRVFIRDRLPEDARYVLRTGDPAQAVLECAENTHVSLIILGLKPYSAEGGRKVWRHAYKIVSEAPCPVLTVRADWHGAAASKRG